MITGNEYGGWGSPITAELLAEGGATIREVVVDGDMVWWAELRPTENGRTAICCRELSVGNEVGAGGVKAGEVMEVSPAGADVDSRIHSYGGAAWWAQNGILYFADSNTNIFYKSKVFSEQNKGEEISSRGEVKGSGVKQGEIKQGEVEQEDVSKLLALTVADTGVQYGDGRPTPDGKYFICIRETENHSAEDEPVNEIVAIATDGSLEVMVLVSGADFYSFPRVSPDGKNLAWVQWNHPNMSWDNSELWIAPLDSQLDKKLGSEVGDGGRRVAGGKGENGNGGNGGKAEWIFQPEWTSENQLAYISDKNGWSGLYICEAGKTSEPTKILELEAEIAVPQWVLGESRYCFLPSDLLDYSNGLAYASSSMSRDTFTIVEMRKPRTGGIVAFLRVLRQSIAKVREQAEGETGGQTGKEIGEQVWTEHTAVSQVRPYKDGVIALAGSWETEPEIVYIGRAKKGGLACEVVYSPTEMGGGGKGESEGELDKRFFPPPEFVQFPTTNSETAFGLYYEPANPDYESGGGGAAKSGGGAGKGRGKNGGIGGNGEGENKPPLVVMAHGGPTSYARTSLYLGHRFWTSRGFAVLDVNYRGSTGFGRKYREALYGKWGKADTEDCIAGATHLIQQQKVNPEQIMIRGSSAGGLTVLMALALSDIFSCGAIRYGIADLKALGEGTHKFESRYLYNLVGAEKNFTQNSPVNHIDKITTPMIIMSGTEDPVVPPAQSQDLATALEAKGVTHELIMFEGEGHGFRQAQTQIRALTAELDFVKEVFGLGDSPKHKT